MNATTKTNMKKTWLALSLLVVSFAALYHHVFAKLVHDWVTDDNYSHGFLVPIISGYLVWQARERLGKIELTPTYMGLPILLAGLILFLVSYLSAELFTMRFSLLVVIYGSIVFLAGTAFGRALFVPVAYLLFMIPLPAIIWNKIAFPLKIFATKMAVVLTGLLQIPVYREGNIIHVSNTTLQVVDACSGMRSLASLLALSAAFAFITRMSTVKKWVLFLSAVPIAIALNVFRLTSTAVLAQHYGPQVAQGFLHEMSGIMVFIFAIAILYFVQVLLRKIFPGTDPRKGD
jgi:exosortase